MTSERQLAISLRLIGAVCLLALPAALLPLSEMDSIHRALGLGALPQGPIVEYLARSLSVFYALHGFLFWLMSRDVPRYLLLIRWIAALMLLVPVLRCTSCKG